MNHMCCGVIKVRAPQEIMTRRACLFVHLFGHRFFQARISFYLSLSSYALHVPHTSVEIHLSRYLLYSTHDGVHLRHSFIRLYLTDSPELPSTPFSMCEKMASGATQSSCSGSYSSNPGSVPRYMHYITIGGMPSVVHSGHGRKDRPTQHETSSNSYSSSRAAHKRAVSRIL